MKNTKKETPIFSVGERIAYLRTQKGLSVNKLANLAGISQSYLRDIELENKNPTVELISLICHPLDISLKDFFDVESTNSLNSDPLIQRIYQLNPQQRETLLIFLNTIK